MKRFVLDTSVIIKWFSAHDEDDLEAALNLRAMLLEERCEIIAPDLVIYELANALRYNPRFTARDVADAVNALADMDITLVPPVPPILARAADIAYRHNVTVYDACFLSLAETRKAPAVTADYKFYERVKSLKHIVRLSEIA